jgi:hypothetical protein
MIPSGKCFCWNRQLFPGSSCPGCVAPDPLQDALSLVYPAQGQPTTKGGRITCWADEFLSFIPPAAGPAGDL